MKSVAHTRSARSRRGVESAGDNRRTEARSEHPNRPYKGAENELLANGPDPYSAVDFSTKIRSMISGQGEQLN